MGRAVARWESAGAAAALDKWAEFVAERRRVVELAGKMVARARNKLLAKVYLAWAAHAMGCAPAFVGELAASFAEKKLGTPLPLVFSKAIACNWLVCLAIYLAGAADDVVGKICPS